MYIVHQKKIEKTTNLFFSMFRFDDVRETQISEPSTTIVNHLITNNIINNNN